MNTKTGGLGPGDREGGGWRARTRVAALMYASGGLLAGLSLLPAQSADVHKSGILAAAVVALLTSVGILAAGRRYTLAVSHGTSAAGTAIIASVIWMAGDSYLSSVYPLFYVWVVLYSVFFYGTRGALLHTLLCSTAVAMGLAARPPSERMLLWAVITATLCIVVACYHFIAGYTKRLRGLVENSGGIVTVMDSDCTIAYHSASAERILGYGPGQLVSRNVLDLVHPEDRVNVRESLRDITAGQSATTTLECRMRHKSGAWLHMEADVQNLLSDASIDGIVLSLRDVTERRRLQEQLVFQAFHDPLTELANRALFNDRVAHALQRRPMPDRRPGVLLLDLDDFKLVNDTMGHGAGDELLTAVANRLRMSLRAADTLARLGGDEFAVLIDSCDDAGLAEIAHRLIDDLRQPVTIEGHNVIVTPSIGGAMAVTGLQDVDDLLRDADAAMYLAKKRGKGRYEAYEPGMSEEIVRRAQLKGDLRPAVQRGEFELLYQPTIDLSTGNVHGMEALIRWQHPALGTVLPTEFIPLAEETGLINEIGRWVLHEACNQAAQWRSESPAWPSLLMSVNVSARQLNDDGFVDDVETALRSSGLEPSDLILELTESALISDSSDTTDRLRRLKDTGVTIALDDFGTGYSTLTYLRTLPLDLIKVDKSFIDDLAGPLGERHEFLRALVGLIQSLDLPSVAEGIEQPEQAERLRLLNCEYGQGYLFARPLSVEEARAWMRQTAESLTPDALPA